MLGMKSATTILFVDDEKLVIKYFRKAFCKSFKIETADSVSNAKLILDSMHSEIAVILSDLYMPKQSGIELLLYAKNNYPDIVRLLTSAFSDTGSGDGVINKADVFSVILKPWDLDKLEMVLNEAIQNYGTSDL